MNFLRFLIVVCLFVSSTFSAYAETFKYFSDVQQGDKNYDAIVYLYSWDVVDGYEDGSFRPGGSINRAELMKLVVAMSVGEPGGNYSNCFDDVADQWFAPYVCFAKVQGWVDGYEDGTFRPGDFVNRVEAMKIILNSYYGQFDSSGDYGLAAEVPSDVDVDAWYSPFALYVFDNKLADMQHVKDNKYLPSNDMTRKEVVQMIYNLVLLNGDHELDHLVSGFPFGFTYNDKYILNYYETDDILLYNAQLESFADIKYAQNNEDAYAPGFDVISIQVWDNMEAPKTALEWAQNEVEYSYVEDADESQLVSGEDTVTYYWDNSENFDDAYGIRFIVGADRFIEMSDGEWEQVEDGYMIILSIEHFDDEILTDFELLLETFEILYG